MREAWRKDGRGTNFILSPAFGCAFFDSYASSLTKPGAVRARKSEPDLQGAPASQPTGEAACANLFGASFAHSLFIHLGACHPKRKSKQRNIMIIRHLRAAWTNCLSGKKSMTFSAPSPPLGIYIYINLREFIYIFPLTPTALRTLLPQNS